MAASARPELRAEPWLGTPSQNDALRRLRERMRGCAWGKPSEEDYVWYLRDRSFDVDEAADKLERTMRFRREFRPQELTKDDVRVAYATGVADLLQTRDRFGRPVLVIRAANHTPGRLRASEQLGVYLVERALETARGSGVEEFVSVFDMRGVTPANIDLALLRFIIDLFFVYYPRRIGVVYFVNVPFFFNAVWSAIAPSLSKYASLVRFEDSGSVLRELGIPKL